MAEEDGADAVIGNDGTMQLWAVVCSKLHTSFGPFSEQDKALRFAARLSLYSEAAESEGRTNKACEYVVIPMWVQTLATTPAVTETDKKKLN